MVRTSPCRLPHRTTRRNHRSLCLARIAAESTMTPLRTIHATAPIRICDNGGWTDTWFARHGKVFNIAVRPVVSVRIEAFPGGTRAARVVLHAENYRLRYAPDLAAT